MNSPSILVEGHWEHANGGLGDSYDPLENKGPHCVHTFSFPHQQNTMKIHQILDNENYDFEI